MGGGGGGGRGERERERGGGGERHDLGNLICEEREGEREI